MAKYFIKLEDPPELELMVSATLAESLRPTVDRPYISSMGVYIADMNAEEAAVLENQGAQVFGDLEFAPCMAPRRYWEAPAAELGLYEVLQQIRAPEAWETTRGRGTTIVIIDSGVCGQLKELPAWKRSPVDLPSYHAGGHFKDDRGHGSMCAVIAAGTNAEGGKFNGVAPDATILSARTTYKCSDIYTIYDEIRKAKIAQQIDGPLVINNSFAYLSCSPSSVLMEDHPFVDIIHQLTDEGAFVTFAAGNNHHDEKCRHDPLACEPNSIWAVNSLDRVLCVGSVNREETNQDPATPHVNSSRGPGEWAQAYPKPDCVAPTYGEVVRNCGYQVMQWWGSSGACAQASGLAALILAVDPTRSPEEVANIIRDTCRPLPADRRCVGHGILDCAAAVAAAS